MKVGIDLSPLRSDPKRRGVSNYVHSIVRTLIKIDGKNEYYFFNTKNVSTDFLGSNFPKERIFSGEITSEISNDLDLFVITNYFDFSKKLINQKDLKCKTVGIVYDLIPIIFWDHYLGGIEKEYFKRLRKIYESDHILTISESAKGDISEILKIDEKKVDVIYAGFEESTKENEEPGVCKKIFDKYKITSDYIFSVPSMDYRKNIVGLIEAYSLLPENIKDMYQLVITNEMTKEYESYLREVASSHNISRHNLIITNYVNHETLRILYANATIFVFPSFYEGFGLPVLEAMSYGIPVITSNVSSLPEVIENAGILINPYDSNEISKAMYKLITDDDLRIDLANRGAIQSKKFTWERTALLAMDSFERIANKKNELNMGMVTTWNIKCGIAEYSRYLLGAVPDLSVTIFANLVDTNELIYTDGSNVVRCWKNYEDNLDNLYSEIILRNLGMIHIQFNFGLFNLKSLSNIIDKLVDKNIRILITFHSTQDAIIGNQRIALKDYVDRLNCVDKIIVHTKGDLDYLKHLGLKNVTLLPQGYKLFEDEDKINIRNELDIYNSIIISNFGFLLPHKGVLETIKAISILKPEYQDVLLLILGSTYPTGDVSLNYLNDCRKEVDKLNLKTNVLFITDYLEEEEIIDLLHISDIVVLPYKNTQESSSASIRFALTSCRPTIVTDQSIFKEFGDEVYKIEKCQPKLISKAVKDIFSDQKLSNKLIDASKRRCKAESWDVVGKNYRNILVKILDQHQ